MGFIDSYKHLEKLCGEVMNDNRRVSAYIDEMLNTPGGFYYVKSWNEDLKNSNINIVKKVNKHQKLLQKLLI